MSEESRLIAELVARDQIRRLPLRYAQSIERRDVDAMASLFVPHARFGRYGEGAAAVKRLMGDTMTTNVFAVILVANHLIELDDEGHAHGEVWAHCFAHNRDDGFIEQLVKYEDRYERYDGEWLFLHRRHRLWYGVRHPKSPLEQLAASWPERQFGVGDLPLEDSDFRDWWRRASG
jgi:hypothetical protein